jgi:PAS domain S-box-containing protein
MKNSLVTNNYNKDFNDIVELVKEVCKVDEAWIHLLEQNDLRLVTHGPAKKSIEPNLISFVKEVHSKKNHLLIEDFSKKFGNQSKQISSFYMFYAGFPIHDVNEEVVGVLSIAHNKAMKLDKIKKKSIEVLSKSVSLLYDKQHLDSHKRSCLNQMLNLNNGFYLKIREDLRITEIGPNFKTSIPEMRIGEKLKNYLVYQNHLGLENLFQIKTSDRSVHFFETTNNNQRYKFSFVLFENEMIISASPIINAKFTLKNYALNLNDFSKHDYIAEYMFLQQTSAKSLKEARVISENLVKRNLELRVAQNEIGELSKFPSENPNPILRFSKNVKLVYKNPASELNFVTDFGIKEDMIFDEDLKNKIDNIIKTKSSTSIFESRNKRHYSLTIVYVNEFEYVNIYASDITTFIKKVNQNEELLIRLKDEMQEQKEFYEFILNNLPADVAVFDKKHKYVFVNPQGIKNKKIRQYMIGKDDFEYFKLKNTTDEKAKQRRKIFNSVLRKKTFVSWQDELIDKKGEREIVQRSMGPLFDENGNVKYVIGYGTDVTKRVLAEEENTRLSLVAKNTNNGVLIMNLSRKIIWANKAILHRSGYTLSEVVGKSSNYFSYKGISHNALEKVKKAMEMKKKISVELLHSSRTGREYWVDLNVQPLYDNDNNHNGFMFVEFDITDRKKNENTIQNLNVNLEQMVQEKTAKNIELSNSLRDQEKMVTIGELAAGVAHDLNTPLGAIRSGADNIKYTLTRLLNTDNSVCSENEKNFILDFSENNDFDLYVGGIQFRKECLLFTKYLKNEFSEMNHVQSIDEIAMMFVKNRISTNESEIIEFIMKSNSSYELLQFLYDIQIIFSFVDTIQASGEKASLVVQDLRSFIKEKKNTKQGMVNLNNNIQTVLNIFNHNIKSFIELHFDVDKTIEIMGLDVRLFQLWSNLIKNSIECMEDMTGLKKLNVYSKKNIKTVSIIVENNGPVIPKDHLAKIFQKFYTTKGKRNGSGLGLSIVKNVLEEHNANISVKSNEQKTQFKITFKKEK